MYTIYVITNLVNSQQYVGKTAKPLQIRLKEHQRYSRRKSKQHLPFYEAIQRYGEMNFSIAPLEENVEKENACEREIYWISKLGTYGGYNSTRGGNGRYFVDENVIIAEYEKCESVKHVRIKTGYDEYTIRKCLHNAGCHLKTSQQIAKETKSVPTRLVSRQGNVIDFQSRIEAANYIAKQKNLSANYVQAHISDVVQGKRKTIGGYIAMNRDNHTS